MKYFHKLFFSILAIVTLAVTVVEYYAVSYSLENAYAREKSTVLSQHALVQYTVRSALVSASEDGAVSPAELPVIGEKAAALMAGGFLSFSDESGKIYYSSLSLSAALPDPAEGCVSYAAAADEAGAFLKAESRFSYGGQTFVLTTAQDISSVFSEADALRAACKRIYLIVSACSVLAAFALAWGLTRPILALQRTSRFFASGNYQIRSNLRTKDEIKELSLTFNQMADTIEEKISELSEAAERQKTFTANFAHELKTPMTSIIGYADTIYQKKLPPAEVRRSAGYILNEAMRLEALSFKLMDLIHLDNGHFILEETEISQVLEDARASILPAAEKRGVSVQASFAPGWVRLEYDLFKTLLLNLLDNALKSGSTTVGLYGAAEGGSYRIRVVDNGRGIPPEELKRITEAFYMVDKSRSRKEHGAGLGLALSARIARLHHTALDYASKPGTGTMVTLTLQAVEYDGQEE